VKATYDSDDAAFFAELARDRGVITQYPHGYWPGAPPTTCRVSWRTLPDGRAAVIVTEIAENRGLSITNNAETILRQLQDVGADVVVEHYDRHSYPGGRTGPASFDLVTLRDGEAHWQHLGHDLDAALRAL
jgi:hypothetical protein